MELPFVDAHTHSLPEKEDVLACVDLSSYEILPGFSAKKVLFSLGIHPAKAEVENMEHLLRKIENAPMYSAVGECGMDKYLSIDLSKQKELFLQQALLAYEMEKPLVIHCVKAWDILYECAKKVPQKKERKWLIHSFRGDLPLAEDLLRHGFTLSLAPQMIKNMPQRVELMKKIPFVLETDDSKEDMDVLYQKTSESCNIKMAELKEKTYSLFCEFYNYSSRG